MNFKEYVEQHRQKVYEKICRYFPDKDPVEHYRISKEYSDRQGSYRRPGLLLLTGQMFGAEINDLLLPAAAMQLSEDWILTHDDIEDHSSMRRGKESLNKLYGMEVALNAGDAGHIIMWKMLKDYVVSSSVGSRLYDKFYDIVEKTVEGQFLDINFIYNKKTLNGADEDLYFKIINSKTCYYTVYGPMQLGAIVAGADEEMLRALEDIGRPAGVSFQIADDLLDMTADEKVFGKQKHGDLYEGKITLIILDAYRKASQEEKDAINRIYAKQREEKTEQDIGFLLQIIDKYRSLEAVMKIGEEYTEKAKKNIEEHSRSLPDNEYTKILMSAITELYSRNK
ncbi:MAG: polyprenyl synthetase family protein [Candidatus Marsarchaeota archaeon]|nr:polyprenyl synthetase family protein [Candidatus Marsarchaeota archaeon]